MVVMALGKSKLLVVRKWIRKTAHFPDRERAQLLLVYDSNKPARVTFMSHREGC